MYPRLVEIPIPFSPGGVEALSVYSFGAMLVVAVLTAAWMTARELDRMYREGRVPGVPVKTEENGRTRTRPASPSILMGTIATLAVIAGIAGSRLFFILENMDQFALDPVGVTFGSGGLTFYGGLLLAAAVLAWYVRKKGLNVWDFADALAPGLILAYGIGRIGCYLAGDGDWGVCSDLAEKPDWLPAWLWSEDFSSSIVTDNVIAFNERHGDVCSAAADGVYPTMLYEFFAAAAICGILWAFRKHPFKAGWLFSLYLVFNGIERFFIEKIRINPDYELFGFVVTQAEVIAVLIFLTGVAGLFFTWKRVDKTAARPAQRAAST